MLKIITHDRISRDGLAALRDVVLAAETPVLYLTGAGEAFCAGAGLDIVIRERN